MDDVQIKNSASDVLQLVWEQLHLPANVKKDKSVKEPLLVKNLENAPSYWLFPIISKNRLLAFLKLSLKGELLAYGTFGKTGQLNNLPPAAYLSQKKAFIEIKKKLKGRSSKVSVPQLVHDGPVDKLAWLSKCIMNDGTEVLFFWSFGYSYSRSLHKIQDTSYL